MSTSIAVGVDDLPCFSSLIFLTLINNIDKGLSIILKLPGRI